MSLDGYRKVRDTSVNERPPVRPGTTQVSAPPGERTVDRPRVLSRPTFTCCGKPRGADRGNAGALASLTTQIRIIIVRIMERDSDETHKRLRQRPKSLAPAVRAVSSEVLLGEAKELRILHEGREYRLRCTRNSRLILTA